MSIVDMSRLSNGTIQKEVFQYLLAWTSSKKIPFCNNSDLRKG